MQGIDRRFGSAIGMVILTTGTDGIVGTTGEPLDLTVGIAGMDLTDGIVLHSVGLIHISVPIVHQHMVSEVSVDSEEIHTSSITTIETIDWDTLNQPFPTWSIMIEGDITVVVDLDLQPMYLDKQIDRAVMPQ